jgi:hypothetical protein
VHQQFYEALDQLETMQRLRAGDDVARPVKVGSDVKVGQKTLRKDLSRSFVCLQMLKDPSLAGHHSLSRPATSSSTCPAAPDGGLAPTHAASVVATSTVPMCRYYLKITDEHFEQAIRSDEVTSEATHQMSELSRKASHAVDKSASYDVK